MSNGRTVLLASPMLLLAACSSSRSTASPQPPTVLPPAYGTPASSAPPSTAADGVVLRVSGYHFPALTVAPGTRLALVDLDSEPHTVTATGGAFSSRSFDSHHPGTLVAPTTPGSYTYTCTIHPTMHGTLVVR